MDQIQTVERKSGVPLEDGLNATGSGLYTWYVIITSGMISFSSTICLQAMAFVIPAAGCDLQLSNTSRGILSSMTFTGMLVSAQIFGFLADTFGRKCVMMYTQPIAMVATVLWSLAPNITYLGVILFIIGCFLTGTYTPAYVFVGEFCPSHLRSKALLFMTAMIAMGNAYLPAMAWLIIPLDVYIPISGEFVFTSWRLYILHLSIPFTLSLLLLSKLPESPKFLYSQGKQEETLEILKSIYAVNQRKTKDEFPILSLIPNSDDEMSSEIGGDGNKFTNYFKKMVTQFGILFSKQYIYLTFMSSFILFGIVGTGNTFFMWLPEQTSRVMAYQHSHDTFNVTLCHLMRESNTGKSFDCNLNYDFMYVGIILGATEMITCLTIGQWAQRMNKQIVMCVSTFLTAGICFLTVFVTSDYIIILCLVIMIVFLFTLLPVIISIVVELFPTQLRSTATSLFMTLVRMGSAIGSQLLGILFENHCRKAYFGLTTLLIASGILCILIPTRKRQK